MHAFLGSYWILVPRVEFQQFIEVKFLYSFNCNQIRSPWLFVQSVIKFQQTTIHTCWHGSIVGNLLIFENVYPRLLLK